MCGGVARHYQAQMSAHTLTSGEEGAPPPSVVLGAEVEVAQEDGGLCTHHHQHNEGQHNEAKHVVHLARPDGGRKGKGGAVGQIAKQRASQAHQMLLRMKKSWMNTQPNGRMPPMRAEGIGWDSQFWSGISRGIWLVGTGCSMACSIDTHQITPINTHQATPTNTLHYLMIDHLQAF